MKKSISITWDVYDIMWRAKERHLVCTEKDAENILDKLEKQHDANVGINWDVIDAHIDQLTEEM